MKTMKASDRSHSFEQEDLARGHRWLWIAVAVAAVMILIGVLMGRPRLGFVAFWPIFFLGFHLELRRERHRERARWRKRLQLQARQSAAGDQASFCSTTR